MTDSEIIVLGAGYAGLSTAAALRARGKSVMILEARERIGGRTRTDHFDQGLWLDIGGQWAGPGQDRLYGLIERFGKRLWPMYTQGRNVLHLDGKHRRYRGLIPTSLGPLALLNLSWGFARLEWLAKRIPLEAPWDAKQGARLDQQSIGDWMRRNLKQQRARLMMQVAVEAVFAAHPDDISLLHGLFYMRSGGGLENLTSSAGGAQQDRIDGGMQGLAESWAEQLRTDGCAIRLNTPVRAVEQDGNGVSVHTDDGVFRGDRVISTLPPALTLEVDFRPGLPEARREWCAGMVPGRVIKCFAVYPKPFWREQGLSGSAAGDQGPLHVSFDGTPPDSTQGILLGFIEGREAGYWAEQNEEDRRQAVLACMGRFFGDQALAPERYIDHAWSTEQWSRGCYAGVPGPGLISRVGVSARQPLGRVHWAGTETATRWNGYIEGAILSGERVAAEIT
ncbi:MAG: FAD-dependent oxidoreductase [Halomonadaceae bacterium]|nr:MAG: FAD-dependent oxidoreductase [Halomonadaceae bacterium]